MQKQNDLARNLKNLFNESSYTEFDEGFFVNQPEMKGYYYIFKNINRPCFCLILNTSETLKYPSDSTKIKDYVYIVFNIRDLKDFLENLASQYLPVILTKIDENILKKNPRNLPYGYYTDVDGEVKIDLRKANEVRKIYDMYIEVESVREIADELKTNFSHVRDVLADFEVYLQMKNKIVTVSKLKRVGELMAENVKGRYKNMSTEDEIKELRKRRKQQQKAMAMNQ
jgi:hypothetical protein